MIDASLGLVNKLVFIQKKVYKYKVVNSLLYPKIKV